jgi:hypothetical protein
MRFLGLRTVLCFAGVLSFAACAPDNKNPSGADGDGDGGSTSSNNNSGGDDGNGAGTTTFGEGAANSTGTLMECASEAIEAELSPLTMFIAFDKSGSMDSNNKWDNATAALTAFIQSPTAADMEVALRFFPDGGCNEGACDVNACATPNVPVGMLTADPAPADAQEAALIAAINATGPGGGTPMSAALEGALQFSNQYLLANPDHKTVVILVTDGEPSGCEENIGAIANIAATGLLEGTPTYAVGLAGSNESQMQQIATQGGGSAILIGNGDVQTELLQALQAIQGEQLACEIVVPTPTMGTLDPAKVNVSYTPGGGGAEETIGKVADEASCGPGGGWYYDDNTNPTTIFLCPATCESVQADDEGKIEVVLGCTTIPA